MKIIPFLNLLSGSVLPLLFWVFLMFGFDTPYVVILSFICAAVHELSHLGAARLLLCKTDAPTPHISGFRIKTKTPTSYKSEILILAAGPLSNILISVIIFLLPVGCGYLDVLAFVSLATGLSNLLPVEGYDGYGIARALLLYVGKEDYVRRLEGASFAFCILMTFFSLYLLDKSNSGYWLFAIFFISAVKNIHTSISKSIF